MLLGPEGSCSWLCGSVVWFALVMLLVIDMVVVCSRCNLGKEEANL